MGGRLKLTASDRHWARRVKERDNWSCVICGNGERLNAHHIIPREVQETKLDVNNGISLCPKHHFFSRLISAHNNPLAMFMWMEEYKPMILEYLRNKQKEIWQKEDNYSK